MNSVITAQSLLNEMSMSDPDMYSSQSRYNKKRDSALKKLVQKKLPKRVLKDLSPEEVAVWDKTHVATRMSVIQSIKGDMLPIERIVAAIKLQYKYGSYS